MQAAASNSPPATFAPKAAQGLDPEGRGMAQAGVDTQEQPGGREKPTAAQASRSCSTIYTLGIAIRLPEPHGTDSISCLVDLIFTSYSCFFLK